MGIEIEKKFLLKNTDWRGYIQSSRKMEQGYFETQGNVTVRVRLDENIGRLTIKGPTTGMSRSEFEYEIPAQDAREILDQFCGTRIVKKTRHFVPWKQHTWEIDEFDFQNKGLFVAEIELTSENESFAMPPWIGNEVSHDKRFSNAALANTPFSQWDNKLG